MRCEACGGDGLIEHGAYRGDEHSPVRPCQLCGGIADEDLEWLKQSQFKFHVFSDESSASSDILPRDTDEVGKAVEVRDIWEGRLRHFERMN
jgi:uncharacterized Zn finger protein